MRIQYDCFPCIFKQVLSLAGSLPLTEEEKRAYARELLAELARVPDETTAPEMASILFSRHFEKMGGERDLYAGEKSASTRLAIELYPAMTALVKEADDPFTTAVRLAIGGNVIDFGATPDFKLESAEQAVRNVMQLPFDAGAVQKLKEKMEEAASIFYILDNCGEAVLDNLLIDFCRRKVTLGVRGKAIYNDMTRAELEGSGLGDLPVVDTGDRAPGVSLKNSSPVFLEKLYSSDLVIAKGQGNYESLEDRFDRPVFFLFRAKCPVIARQIPCPAGSVCIIGKNL